MGYEIDGKTTTLPPKTTTRLNEIKSCILQDDTLDPLPPSLAENYGLEGLPYLSDLSLHS